MAVATVLLTTLNGLTLTGHTTMIELAEENFMLRG
eukprot:COSAG06_NODE_66776_length_252_cov_1.012987_1_plen_34_part_10